MDYSMDICLMDFLLFFLHIITGEKYGASIKCKHLVNSSLTLNNIRLQNSSPQTQERSHLFPFFCTKFWSSFTSCFTINENLSSSPQKNAAQWQPVVLSGDGRSFHWCEPSFNKHSSAKPFPS